CLARAAVEGHSSSSASKRGAVVGPATSSIDAGSGGEGTGRQHGVAIDGQRGWSCKAPRGQGEVVGRQAGRGAARIQQRSSLLVDDNVIEGLAGRISINALRRAAIEVHRVPIRRKRAAVVGPVTTDIHRRAIRTGQRSTAIDLNVGEKATTSKGAG